MSLRSQVCSNTMNFITKKNVCILCAIFATTLLPMLVWYSTLPPHTTVETISLHHTVHIEQPYLSSSVGSSLPTVNTSHSTSLTVNISHSTPPTHTTLLTESASPIIYPSLVMHQKAVSHSSLPLPSIKPIKYLSHQTDCSTVHVAMVASGAVASRHLYTTIKFIIMHRSTPLHFHFITDNRAKTVLQTMINTWLVPAISHDYYDLNKAWTTIDSSFSQIYCSQTLSLHLNLDLVLPTSIGHVIVIEPSSVVGTDLAKLWSLTVSRTNYTMTVCQSNCVSYCNDGDSIELTKWGAVGLSFHTPMTKETKLQYCVQNPIETGNISIPKNVKEECAHFKKQSGDVLKYIKLEGCLKGAKYRAKKPPSKKDQCKLFAWERRGQRRELPFVLGHRYTSSGDYDVTLATHLDYNRLDLLERILGHWDGPASVTIHVTDSQAQGVVDFLLHSKLLQHRENVSYHFLFRVGPSYPPNHARELAHRFVSTPYMLILDVDYVSSFGLYDSLKEKLKAGTFGNMEKTAVVIPAFETNENKFKVPHTKAKMVGMFVSHKVHQFHHKFFYPGHGPTNYKKWKTATKPYYVSWKNDYEPYYVVKTSVVSFDHRFIARFSNKCSHSTELHMAGYKFLVFPHSFVVHLPHKTNQQNMNNLRKCSRKWYSDWIKEKRKQYHYKKKDVRNYLVA